MQLTILGFYYKVGIFIMSANNEKLTLKEVQILLHDINPRQLQKLLKQHQVIGEKSKLLECQH